MANEQSHSVWVVDQMEEGTASIEVDGDRMITVPRRMLPNGVREGHVLRVTIDDTNVNTKFYGMTIQYVIGKGVPGAPK